MHLPILHLTTLLATAAAQVTPYRGPSASINWNGLDHIRVYGQDPYGYIVEWGSDGSWYGPNRIGYKAKYGTEMAAIVALNADGSPRIRVYYYADDGRYREAVWEGQWGGGALLP